MLAQIVYDKASHEYLTKIPQNKSPEEIFCSMSGFGQFTLVKIRNEREAAAEVDTCVKALIT